MNRLKKNLLLLAFAGSMLMGGQAFAQQWDFSIPDVNGQAGDTVSADLTIDHTGSEEAFTIDITVGNLALFGGQGGVDLSSCLDNFPPQFIESCAFRAAPNDDTIRIQWSADAPGNSWPNTPVVAPLSFTIDGAASPGDSSALTIAAVTINGTVNTTDGSVTVVSGPQSQLSLTPASINFGTVDLGNMPVTDTFTVENIGDAGTTANITGASLAGPDAEFTIAADNCTGQALGAGATCTVDIQFNAGSNGTYSNQLDITSDADLTPNPSGAIDGAADSVAQLSVSPPFGTVDLGNVFIGTSSSANGSVSNSGSASGDFTCSLAGDPEITVNPSPVTGPVAPGDSVPFSLTCSVPDGAADGTTYSATLSCSGDNGFSGTHDVTCRGTTIPPIPVPTMNKWGLAVLALLMVMIGGLTVRFFRA